MTQTTPVSEASQQTYRLWQKVLVGGYHLSGSATNLGFTVATAVSLSATAFGYLSLPVTAYIFCAGIWRSLGSEAALVSFSAASPPTQVVMRGLRVNAVWMALATCGLLGTLAVVVPGARTPSIAMMFPVMAMAIYDAEIAILLAVGLAVPVTLISSVPAVAMLAIALLTLAGLIEVSALSAALALGVSSTVAVSIARLVQRRRIVRVSASSHLDTAVPYRLRAARNALFFEYLVQAGSFHLPGYLIAWMADVVEAGAYRATILATSPVTTLLVAIRHVIVVRMRADRGESGLAVRHAIPIATASVAAITIVLCAVVFAFGPVLFGETWEVARPVLLPMAAAVVFSTPMTMASGAVRAKEQFGRMTKLRTIQAPLVILTSVIGAWIDGARGVAIGLSVTILLLTPFWIRAGWKGGAE